MNYSKKELDLIGYKAPLWRRVFAYVIDKIVINIIIVLPFNNVINNLYSFGGKDFIDIYSLIATKSINLLPLFYISLIIAILSLMYWTVFEYMLRQSVGKMLFKIYVKSKLKKLKFWQCFIRNVTKISLLILIFDSLYIIITKKNQRYFEKISYTEVINSEI